MAPRRKVDRVESALERRKRLELELEQARRDEAAEAEENAKKGPRVIAAAWAFKWAISELKAAGRLHDDYVAVAVQKMPRETTIAKEYGLSETEQHNVIERLKKAIAGL